MDEHIAAVEERAPLARYEFKYLVSEADEVVLREAISAFCAPDTHNTAGGYTISSLYLDTPDRLTYRAKKDRQLERFKLRIRTYGEQAEGPVFFEVKRKSNDRIIKHRTRVDREHWREVLRGSRALPAEERDAAHHFLYLTIGLGARPSVLVRYRREAFSSFLDPYARVTFDHRIVVQAPKGLDLLGDPRAWRGIDHPEATRLSRSMVVLELKFPAAFPSWMASLVRRFELWRIGFSKYCNGVEVLFGTSAPGRESMRVPTLGHWNREERDNVAAHLGATHV